MDFYGFSAVFLPPKVFLLCKEYCNVLGFFLIATFLSRRLFKTYNIRIHMYHNKLKVNKNYAYHNHTNHLKTIRPE